MLLYGEHDKNSKIRTKSWFRFVWQSSSCKNVSARSTNINKLQTTDKTPKISISESIALK